MSITLKLHGCPQEFSQGGASPKKAPLKTKKAPPQKKIERGLGGMLPRENFNNGAPYDQGRQTGGGLGGLNPSLILDGGVEHLSTPPPDFEKKKLGGLAPLKLI